MAPSDKSSGVQSDMPNKGPDDVLGDAHEVPNDGLDDAERRIFQAVGKNDADVLKVLLTSDQKVDIFDELLMTPLQHACYRGNRQIVQLLLDRGADVNLCRHGHGYTALHFAGLSGNAEICQLLLSRGADASAINTVGRTPAQMAAFVGHHNCVATVNNHVPRADIDRFTFRRGDQPALLPPFIADAFHKFVMQINVHPVRVALSLARYAGLCDHLAQVKAVLDEMSRHEMKRGAQNNEVMAFRYHYLSHVTGELLTCKERQTKPDFIEAFAKRLLKSSADGNLEAMEAFLRDCVRLFPYECTLLRQMVASLASKDAPPALTVVMASINGHRGFLDNTPVCNACGEEKPAKKCAKCKTSQYCDRECQRLHWSTHKKSCSTSAPVTPATPTPDPAELNSYLKNLLVEN